MTIDPTRRDFLKAAGAGAMGLAAVACAPATGTASGGATGPAGSRAHWPDVDKRRGVELAIATITMDGFGDRYWEDAFRLAPEIGVRNVEFNAWYPRTMTLEAIRSIRERSRQRGLTPVCIQGTGFGGDVLKDVTHKLWSMEQAKALGCRRVKFTGARRGTDGGLENVIATLEELAPAAEEMDVLVLVENHANNVLESIEDYEKIFEAIPSKHVGLCLDMAHFDGANVDNFEVVSRFHHRILHIDVKDTERKGIHKVVNYGTGVTDMHGIIGAALSNGYTGYLLIEQAPPLNATTLVADLTRAREMFSQYVR